MEKLGKGSKELFVRKIKFGLSVVCILIMSWFASMYWVTGEVMLDLGEMYTLDFDSNDDIKYTMKDLKVIDKDTFKSTSVDSYVVVEFSNPVDVCDMYLDITLRKGVEVANCQIFYTSGNEDFASEDSVRKELKSGENLIQIDGAGLYKKIRIDFVDEKGVKFDVNSLQLYENYVPSDFVWIFVLVSIVLTGISYLYFLGCTIKFKLYQDIVQKWSNIPVRSRRMIQLLTLCVLTLFIVIGRIVYSNQVMAYGDIGSDTLKQYLPQYNLIVNKIRSGSLSLWLPEVGYGYNIGHFFLFSPFLIMVLILGAIFGNAAIPGLVILYKVSVILLCAYVAFRFLEKFSNNYSMIALCAYMYAFNGFAIVWGQHYVFFEYPLYAIVVFFLVEKFIQDRNKKFDLAIILVSFVSMAFSVYMSYMVYLPAGVYAIIRYIYINEKFNIKDFICRMFNLVLNIIIGFVGGQSIGLIYVKNILSSGRTDGDTSNMEQFLESLKLNYLSDDFLGSLQRFVSGNLSGIGSEHVGLHNYYEEPQIFFTVIFLIVLAQFIFTVHKNSDNIKQMLCKYLAVVLVGLAIFNKGILFALYAFSQDARRTVFALFPVMAMMMVVVLDNIFRKKILSKVGLALGTIATAIVLLYNRADFVTVEKQLLLAVSLITLIVSVVVFLCANSTKKVVAKRGLILALSIALFMNITSEMYVSVNRIGLVEQGLLQETGMKKDTREAVEYVESIDDSYYRMDKTYIAWNEFTDAYFVNYNAISSYNAMLPNNIKAYNELFMNPLFLSIKDYKPCFVLAPNDIVQYSSLGLKYILSHYKLPDNKHYELLKQVGNVYVYRNLASDSFTTFFDDVVLRSEFITLGYNDRNIVQQKAMVIEDEDAKAFEGRIKSVNEVISEYEYEDLISVLSVDGSDISKLYGTTINTNKEIIVSADWNRDGVENLFMEMVVKPTVSGKVNIYFDRGNGYSGKEMYQMLCYGGQCEIRYAIPNDVQKIKLDFSAAPSEVLEFSLSSTMEEIKNSDNPSVLNDNESNSKLTGDITCDRDGLLYIPLPYDSNWKIEIDGEEAKTYVANAGFCAVNISKGTHKIEIRYESWELKVGMLCFGVAAVIAVIYYLVCNRITKEKNSESIKQDEE